MNRKFQKQLLTVAIWIVVVTISTQRAIMASVVAFARALPALHVTHVVDCTLLVTFALCKTLVSESRS